MSSRFKKRKHRQFEDDANDEPQPPIPPDASLYIRAHEADLVRGPQAFEAARSLEVTLDERGQTTLHGDGLIEWVGSGGAYEDADSSEHHTKLGHAAITAMRTKGEAIWVDRYDARLLLDALPDVSTPAPVTEPGSPGGWSDLPSDAEDTFFFSPDEIEDYRRDKRRRVIHEDRQARLRAIRAEAPDDDDDVLADPRENWGGSDEEPDDTQRELMQRTATHVLASPNPAQLEMRILANHGADSRFAFLRGRWARAWRLIKTKTRLEREAAVARERISEHKETAGIGGLAGYGDSDEDSEGGGHNDGAEAEEHSISQPPEQEAQARSKEIEVPGADSDDTLKAARRARAREWAEKRRMAKASNSVPQ